MLSLFAIQLPEIHMPPRLRTILPNGATVLVEKVPGAKTVWTRLFLSARGTEETPATHGQRHLLEHLVATGRDGKLDEKLEREGAFLRAQTQRDAIEFGVDAPAGKLDIALGALGEMLRLRAVTTEEIAREAGIIRQEGALMEVPTRLSAAAWGVAYGTRGLAPFGDLDAIRRTTPAALAALHRRLCAGPNLVLVVAGDVDIEKATAAAAAVVRTAPKTEGAFTPRPPGKSGEDDAAQGFGEARALPVTGYSDPKTAATLAAALALGSELGDAFVTYTPSGRNGLVILGRAGENNGLAASIARKDPAALWERGRLLADLWLRRQTADPGANASLRGLLLAQFSEYTPDRMREAIIGMKYADFAAAVEGFQGPKAVAVVGS